MEHEKVVKEARKIIESHFRGDDYTPKLLDGPYGVFVTLTKQGRLRGCIGMLSIKTLSDGLRAAALGVLNDPRFPPIEEGELKDLVVEVSLLSAPKKSGNPLGELRVGKHGIIVKKGFHSGLLLPQVATEYGMDANEFLEAGCEKAGLPRGCWRDAEIYLFEASVFKERS